jgi:hypothetical protein
VHDGILLVFDIMVQCVFYKCNLVENASK